jgi:hypothetical protein
MQPGVDDDDIDRTIRVIQILGILPLCRTVDVSELEILESELSHDSFIERAAADDQDAVRSCKLASSDQLPQNITVETCHHVAHRDTYNHNDDGINIPQQGRSKYVTWAKSRLLDYRKHTA